MVPLGSTSIIYFPWYVHELEPNPIYDFDPFISITITSLRNIHYCCAREFSRTDTTFQCLSGIRITILFLWLGIFFLRLVTLSLSFVLSNGPHFSLLFLWWICRPNSPLFLSLNVFSTLTSYWYRSPSEHLSKKSIYVWMYLCRPLWYFSTKFHLESLIPISVCKV